MEKTNEVRQGLTPCKVCQGGVSEYVCPRCKSEKKAETTQTTLFDPEEFSEAHKS